MFLLDTLAAALHVAPLRVTHMASGAAGANVLGSPAFIAEYARVGGASRYAQLPRTPPLAAAAANAAAAHTAYLAGVFAPAALAGAIA